MVKGRQGMQSLSQILSMNKGSKSRKSSKGRKGIQSIGQILAGYDYQDKKKYVTREFQDYGLRLAQELDDEKRKSLYIKLAKEIPRKILEEARIFVKDAYKVKNKAKLFMWKLKELKTRAADIASGDARQKSNVKTKT